MPIADQSSSNCFADNIMHIARHTSFLSLTAADSCMSHVLFRNICHHRHCNGGAILAFAVLQACFSSTDFAAPHIIMLAPTPVSKYIAHHACIQDTAVYHASNCCGGPGSCHITIVIDCLDGGESNTDCLAEHFSWDSAHPRVEQGQ
jgi:hypothetical protein